MQILVFVAFAAVLWLPPGFQPVASRAAGRLAGLGAVLYPLVTSVVSFMAARLVIRQLDHRPPRPLRGQQIYSAACLLIRVLIMAGLAGQLLLTGWVPLVRQGWGLERVWGLDEVVILLPFVVSLICSWVFLYAADRAIRHLVVEARLLESAPVHPVWTLKQYLSFHLRHQLFVVLVPMVAIIVTYDATRMNAGWFRRLSGVPWAENAVLAVVAGAIFLVAPAFLCWIWNTAPLPPGELRSRLTRLCERVGLRYRQIMIWRSQGLVVNAAVTGLVPQVRYVLLSDGLIEALEDEKIDAVFGHEAGHVKHHHIFYFLNFAILSMLVAGGVMELAGRYRPGLLSSDYVHLAMGTLLGAIWLAGFGWISRRFERQADLYGVQATTGPAGECTARCFVHPTLPVDRPPRHAVCTTAVRNFCEALERIAILNGIPIHAHSWRHSSIASRMQHLQRLAADPAAAVRFGRVVWAIKAGLVISTLIGLAIAAWMFRPF